MPLVGAVDGHIPLLQQQVLSVGNGVDGALVHIGQLQHGVGLTPEEEARLLFVVEKGVNPLHLDPPGQRQLPDADGQGLRLRPGAVPDGHADGAGLLIGDHGKADAGIHLDRLIQVEELERLIPETHGQNGHAGVKVQKDGAVGCVAPGFPGCGHHTAGLKALLPGQGVAPVPFSPGLAVGSKGQDIQILNHRRLLSLCLPQRS